MMKLKILIPVFNDWQSVGLLLPLIDSALASPENPSGSGCCDSCDVLLVDDGSTQPPDELKAIRTPSRIGCVEILHLRRNLGHQRAIAVGLVYLYQQGGADAVLVMDGDGEDRPDDIPSLLDAMRRSEGRKVIFAARTKRPEGALFRSLYFMYRFAHWLLTGIRVRVGNFSLIPAAYLGTLAVSSDLWNHYAAAVFRARIPIEQVPLARGARLAGQPKMNLTALHVHGFSAMSVFSDVISVRLLFFAGASAFLSAVLLGVVIAIRLFTNLAIPGWTSSVAGILVVIISQMVLLAIILVFLVISGRDRMGFLPIRDSQYFVRGNTQIYP